MLFLYFVFLTYLLFDFLHRVFGPVPESVKESLAAREINMRQHNAEIVATVTAVPTMTGASHVETGVGQDNMSKVRTQ